MKKFIKGLILSLSVLLLAGCFKMDNMEGINIYTTVYPIEYIAKYLYGENATIQSIYPNGIDPYNYELTDKQINDYSKANLFVYNGLSNEKEIARTFVNKNKNINIIDVAYGLNIEYGTNSYEELWLSPNNFLMLATTFKNNLKDMIKSTYIKEDIDTKYADLQKKVSIIDAELRTIGSSAKDKNKNTLIVSSNVFKYLENYGFKVISLEDSNNYTNELKQSFKNKTYQSILIKDGETNDNINDLVKNYGAKTVSVNMLNVLSDEEVKNNETYLSIMNNYLTQISDITLN